MPQKSAYDPFAPGQTGDYPDAQNPPPGIPYQQEQGKGGAGSTARSIFATILGAKHGENLRQEHNKAKFIMEQLHDVATNPNNQMPDETVDWLIQQAGSVLGKDMGGAIKQHFEQIRAKKDLERRQAMLPGHQPAQQPQPQAQPQAPASAPQQPPGLPQPPSEAGGPAGAAPAQPNPAPAIQKASALGATGFNVPPPANVPAANVPAPSGGSMFRRGATQLGVDAAAIGRPSLEAKGEVEAAQAARNYELRKARFANEPWFQALSDRQKAELIGGEHIAPEPHYNLTGQVEADGNDRDYLGNPVEPGTLGNRRAENGKLIFQATVGVTRDKPEIDPNSSTGWSLIVRDRVGNELSRRPSAPPAAYVPSTTTNARNGEQVVVVGDQVRAVPVTSGTTSTRSRAIPGMPPPNVAPGAGAAPYDPFAAGQTGDQPPAAPVSKAPAPARPTTAPRASAPAQGAGRTIGESPAAFKMRVENEYTPNGQKVMGELFPRMEMIKRLIGFLEPNKNDDMPASHLLDTLAYRMGYAGNTGGFLSQLQLGSIGQAGSLIKGVSRAKEVLDKAMVHTPAAWKDSSKMMYQKLTEIYRNMEDMKKGVDMYEKKFPGLGTPPPGSMTAPPTGRDPLGIR